MAAQKGIEMLVKVSSDGTSGGTMNTAAGGRSTSLTINNSPIDITSADDTDLWRELMAGGVRSISVSLSGVFKDDTAQADMIDHAAGTTETLAYLQIIIPDFQQIAGSFHISSLEFSGEYDGEVAFSATFESAGAPTITPI